MKLGLGTVLPDEGHYPFVYVFKAAASVVVDNAKMGVPVQKLPIWGLVPAFAKVGKKGINFFLAEHLHPLTSVA
jgi:hypothetical protein